MAITDLVGMDDDVDVDNDNPLEVDKARLDFNTVYWRKSKSEVHNRGS